MAVVMASHFPRTFTNPGDGRGDQGENQDGDEKSKEISEQTVEGGENAPQPVGEK